MVEVHREGEDTRKPLVPVPKWLAQRLFGDQDHQDHQLERERKCVDLSCHRKRIVDIV